MTTILFGDEDEPDARFVQLEDCNHIFEVKALDHYMTQDSIEDDKTSIQLKKCPQCKTPIRRNMRYGDIIKNTLIDIEKVKTQIRGEDKDIKKKYDAILAAIKKFSSSDPEAGEKMTKAHVKTRMNIQELYSLENLLNAMKKISKLQKSIEKEKFDPSVSMVNILVKIAVR